MKSSRTRCLLVFFAAMLLANNAIAAARACIVHVGAPEHIAGATLDSGGEGRLCSAPDVETNCPEHVAQNFGTSDPTLFLDAPSVALAPPRALHRTLLPAAPRRLVLASIPPVVGPPLTILFHNLRN